MKEVDYSKFYPHLKRVSLSPTGDTPEASNNSLAAQVRQVPSWAEPEMMHMHRSYQSMEELRRDVTAARAAGVRHHAFHYYGMSRRYQLEWIGHCRGAWA